MSMTGMMQRCWEHDDCAPSFSTTGKDVQSLVKSVRR